MKIVKDKKHPEMYRIQWPDGTLSQDSIDPKPWAKGGFYGFYNKSRAFDLAQSTHIQNLGIGEVYNASKRG